MTHPMEVPSCRTPDKVRFGSRAYAKTAARNVKNNEGVTLHVYRCSCGFWHLTKKPTNHADASHDGLTGIGQALGMDADLFEAVVMRELYGEVPDGTAEILGHRDVRTRWAQALAGLKTRTEAQIQGYPYLKNTRGPAYLADLEDRLRLIEDRQSIAGSAGDLAEEHGQDA